MTFYLLDEEGETLPPQFVPPSWSVFTPDRSHYTSLALWEVSVSDTPEGPQQDPTLASPSHLSSPNFHN